MDAFLSLGSYDMPQAEKPEPKAGDSHVAGELRPLLGGGHERGPRASDWVLGLLARVIWCVVVYLSIEHISTLFHRDMKITVLFIERIIST